MNLVVTKNYQELSEKTAHKIAGYINSNPGGLFCFAAGDTPLGAFRELIKLQEQGKVNLSSVDYAGLDEWVGLGYETKGSCKQVMFDEFYTPAGISPERIHVFDGLNKDLQGECTIMEDWIAAHGRIQLSLLGVGLNGHIGFNEPNIPTTEGCVIADLDQVTKEVCPKYFGKKITVEKGITIGMSLLLDSDKMMILANGQKKAALMKTAFTEPATMDLPVSMLQAHSNLSVMLDEEAATELLALA